MADIIVASFPGPAIEIGKRIAEPIKRQLNYLCCFDSNIQNLRDEAIKLEDAKTGLQMRITAAENNAEVVNPIVWTWLNDVNDIQLNMTRIESELVNRRSGCLTVKSRFSLSKKAAKTTEAMKELLNCYFFDSISHPTLQSRKHIEEDIMTTLKTQKINMIGICGMGGVGKTTMAKRLMNRVKEENLFDETVMVVVSQQVDMLRIQDDIAKSLRLELKDESLSSRAHHLRARLLQGEKRILIVLDDVWKYLKLKDLGIPCESGLEGCTILLTSRYRRVLNEMNAQKVCGIQTLSEVEAWSLFEENIGVLDDQDLLSIAREIVEECKGLPIALVNVAVSLKDKKQRSIWEDALKQLKSSYPQNVPENLEHVYIPLKLSYDFLDSEHAKSIFLLCCLFPKDCYIPLEELTVYAMGLCMFERTWNVGELRNRTFSLVQMLKSRFLLLEGKDPYHVRMHDVVRDVAIFIASQERRINCHDCTWISSHHLRERAELTLEPNSNLRLLLIDESATKKVKINENVFERTGELHVLSMSNCSLISLPHTTKSISMRALVCKSCSTMKKLVNIKTSSSLFPLLEYLWLEDLPDLEEICDIDGQFSSSSFQNLKELRLRDLPALKHLWKSSPYQNNVSNCRNLSSMEIRNCGCLRNLSPLGLANDCLLQLQSLEIFDCEMMEQIFLWNEEENENIDRPSHHIKFPELKLLKLMKLPNLTTFYKGIESIEFPLLTEMEISNCPKLKSLVPITTATGFENDQNNSGGINHEHDDDSLHFFCQPKKVTFENREAIRDLWDGPYPHGVASSFSYLSSICIYKCHSLCNLFSFATTNDCLLQLERLEIWACKMMEQVFLWDIEYENHNDIRPKTLHIRILPKLKLLILQDLPRLTSFCRGIESIEFCLLTRMKIDNCPRLKSLVSSTGGGINNRPDDSHHQSMVAFVSLKTIFMTGHSDALELWFHHVSTGFFAGLGKLSIKDCSFITCLFSSSVVKQLDNLKILIISGCGDMIRVMEGANEKHSDEIEISPFHNLTQLTLENLSRLETFCDSGRALELPELEQVSISGCPQMRRFASGNVTAPKLKSVNYIDTDNKDLNGVLSQQLSFIRAKGLVPIDTGRIHLMSIGEEMVFSKFSSLLNEAAADPGSLTKIISRFRSIEAKIKSAGGDSSDLVEGLYKLIDALRECRIFNLEQRQTAGSKKGFNLLSVIFFKRKMRNTLDEIESELQKSSSDQDSRKANPPALVQQTYPIPDPSVIVEFESQAEKIIAWLMANNLAATAAASTEDVEEAKGFTAIGIVGGVGCGKSALAQKVFASSKIQEEFSPKIWVCLSNMIYDKRSNPTVRVANYILEEIGHNDSGMGYSDVSLEVPLKKLHSRLMGKRYLIVLDGLPRCCPVSEFFSDGLPKNSGGAVIVTSRQENFIREMVDGKHIICLKPNLSDENCWKIFSDAVQQQGKVSLDHPKLNKLKKDVIRNCKGLPLGAKTLADIIPDFLSSSDHASQS